MVKFLRWLEKRGHYTNKACGLKTVADQMRLRKLVVRKTTSTDKSTPPPEKNKIWPGWKLSKVELKEIASPEER